MDGKDTLSDRINNFRNTLKNNQILEEFDRHVFESIIEKVIIGGIDKDGNKDPYMITFIYKTGLEHEIEDAKKAIRILGGKIEKVDRFKLIDSDIGRSIVIISKENKTPKQYPRKAGKPLKEPLK